MSLAALWVVEASEDVFQDGLGEEEACEDACRDEECGGVGEVFYQCGSMDDDNSEAEEAQEGDSEQASDGEEFEHGVQGWEKDEFS